MLVIISILWIFLVMFAEILDDAYHFLNVASSVLLLTTSYIVIKKGRNFGVIALGIIISYSLASIICAYSETGVWFSEARRFSSLSGATLRNSTLCAITLIMSYLTFGFLGRIQIFTGGLGKKINSTLIQLCAILSLSLSFILVMIYLIYGHPNDYNVDRFYYWMNIAPSWGRYVNFLSTQIVVFLGLAYGINNNKKYLILFFFSLLAQYLVGEKSTGMYSSLIMFILPLLITRGIYLSDIIFKPRFMMLTGIIISTLLIAIYFSYVAIGGADSAIDMLTNRIVLQSQMWWVIDYISSGQGVSSQEIVKGFFGDNSSINISGITYLMREVLDTDTFYWFFEKGVNWTMASPVNLIYFFGYHMAFMPAMLIGLLFGIMSHILYKAILFKDVILIFFSIKLYNAIWQAATMGNISSLFTSTVALSLGMVIFYILATRIDRYK